jgi:hypothetical protein
MYIKSDILKSSIVHFDNDCAIHSSVFNDVVSVKIVGSRTNKIKNWIYAEADDVLIDELQLLNDIDLLSFLTLLLNNIEKDTNEN